MSQVLVCDRPVTGLSRGRHTNRNCATPLIGCALACLTVVLEFMEVGMECRDIGM